MKKIVLAALIGVTVFIFYSLSSSKKENFLSPLSTVFKKSAPEPIKPLEKYSFESLAEAKFESGDIKLEKVISDEEKYVSWLFSYLSEGKKVTGMANIPKTSGPFPAVIMIRGYTDKEIYFTGLETRKAAGVLSENGFLTLAPDFLGFGGSDNESEDILEARFTRPITILSLISSLKGLSSYNGRDTFLWAHSNGGQIAISILEITGKNYPSALWAPVTQSFPESVLGYIDPENISPESQLVLDRFSKFLKNYDPKKYDINSYLDKISAPIQIHQGGSDIWIPEKWQKDIIEKLENLGKKVDYYYYSKSDHNLKQDWDEVILKDIEFYKSHLN